MSAQKIMVVDDEKDLRDALSTALRTSGFEVSEASDGEEGLKKALNEHPDLILLDIGMPLKNGHEVLRELRRDAWGKTVPVLLLTNADDATNISHAVTQGGNDYLMKSQTSLEEITTRVKQYLAGYHN